MIQQDLTPGETLRVYRERQNVSQEDLQKHLGLLHRNELICVEKGRVEPSDAWMTKALTAIDEIAAKVNGNAAA
jgi:DNA-binding XRE family transcriptional regulator